MSAYPEDVAVRNGTHAGTLARVLRALASRGVFEPCGNGRYRLTRLGRLLLPDEPGSSAGLASFRPFAVHAWAEGLHSLRTGEPSFPRHFGMSFWDYLSANPEDNEQFNEQMRRQTSDQLALGLSHYDFPERGTIVDLGGGNGLLLERVLNSRPGLRGVLFDLPHVVEQARPRLRAAGLAGRVEVVGGDLFAEVPAGHDIYVLASVLHDWDDTHAKRILAGCRRAMQPAARLLLFESVLQPGTEWDRAKLLDLHMLVLFGAKERTGDEWNELLDSSGFELARVIPTPGFKSWLEASPRQ